jgi:hypothetical protein
MTVQRRIVAIALTAGVAGVGALALMAPAVADTIARSPVAASAGAHHGYGNGMGNGTGTGTGTDNGAGVGNGRGAGGGAGNGHGPGAGDGTCDLLTITAAEGTLTDAQRTTLASLAQEEQLAHDLYVAFADRYDTAVFDRIATAEQRHLDALRQLMQRYGVTDPTAGKAAGQFADPAARATYDRLLAEGAKSQAAALGVGKQVEQTDLDDLQRALTGLSAPDAQQVYTHLVAASRQHLTAFDRWSQR